MNIVCLSASNIKHSGNNSTSLKACKIIKKSIKEKREHINVKIISLRDYEFKPCTGCGSCFNKENCPNDKNFNYVYNTIINSEGLFIVAPHYAPIPSKLSMILEKIEQIAFLKRFNDESYRSPLFKKPVGIIAHGGGTKEIVEYYKSPVLDSIWNALSYPVEMNVVGVNEKEKHGIVFPVDNVTKDENSVFPIQQYDWKYIEEKLKPLVDKVIDEIIVSSET